MNDKRKNMGQVFTPDWVVNLILDKVGYRGAVILDKFIFEPGCGDGNFLYQIVSRYITAARKENFSHSAIKKGIEKYIYGIELDQEYYDTCIARLNTLAAEHKIKNIKWNIYNVDVIDINTSELPQFNFIVGNPPYVRVHRLDKKYLLQMKSKFNFCKNGIIDLFLAFFEVGIKLLNSDDGKLGFITPNSYIHNSTYVGFRKYLAENKLIKKIINFKEYQIFEKASTYSAITILDMQHKSNTINYYEYGEQKISLVANIDVAEQDTAKWNFSGAKNMQWLIKIKNSKYKICDYAVVQYGFATLLDKAYILPYNPLLPSSEEEKNILYPVVKGSRYNGERIKDRIIYPYTYKNNVWTTISEDELQDKYPETYSHLLSNKKELLKRNYDKNIKYWYEYGRSQGIQTIHNEKLVISPISKNEVKTFKVKENTMVYSGIYLFVKENSKYTLDDFMEIIKSTKFLDYVQIVGKDMRGGYKVINTKAIGSYAL